MELRKTHYNHLYNSDFLRKLVNKLATPGKIQLIERTLFKILTQLKFQLYLNPLVTLLFLLNELRSCMILKSFRLGSVIYQIPLPLVFRKQLFMAITRLTRHIKTVPLRASLEQKLGVVFTSVLHGNSLLFKDIQGLYQTASGARAFIHYRWM